MKPPPKRGTMGKSELQTPSKRVRIVLCSAVVAVAAVVPSAGLAADWTSGVATPTADWTSGIATPTADWTSGVAKPTADWTSKVRRNADWTSKVRRNADWTSAKLAPKADWTSRYTSSALR
jgi:hypothetical protein